METDYHALPPERQPSRGKQRWNAMSGLLRSQAGALRRVRAAGLNPRRHRNSPLAQMLSATSKARHAVLYRNILAGLIVLSVLLFVLSTVRSLSDYSLGFFVLDGIISSCFLVDYVLRIYASYEHHRFRPHGPIVGRLRWLLTWESAFDATSTFPFFYDLLDGQKTFISLGWVRIFRIFLLFRTNTSARAINTCCRVLVVNRQILAVSLALVLFMRLANPNPNPNPNPNRNPRVCMHMHMHMRHHSALQSKP